MILRELISHLTTIANHGHALEEVVFDNDNEIKRISDIELQDLEDKKLIVIK